MISAQDLVQFVGKLSLAWKSYLFISSMSMILMLFSVMIVGINVGGKEILKNTDRASIWNLCSSVISVAKDSMLSVIWTATWRGCTHLTMKWGISAINVVKGLTLKPPMKVTWTCTWVWSHSSVSIVAQGTRMLQTYWPTWGNLVKTIQCYNKRIIFSWLILNTCMFQMIFEEFVSSYLQDVILYHGEGFRNYDPSLQQQIEHISFISSLVCQTGNVQAVLDHHQIVRNWFVDFG